MYVCVVCVCQGIDKIISVGGWDVVMVYMQIFGYLDHHALGVALSVQDECL